MKKSTTKIQTLLFFILLFSIQTKAQSWMELKKAIDSTFYSVDQSKVAPDRFKYFYTKDSLYEVSVLYNELRPRLYFERFKHLTINIVYKGSDEVAFERTYNNLFSALCSTIPIDTSNNRQMVANDNVADTYAYVDKKVRHIHYENFVLNHIAKKKFKHETIYSSRIALKALMNEYQKEITDSSLQAPSNKRWTKVGLRLMEGDLYGEVVECEGKKNSAGYYSEVNHYRFKISDLKNAQIEFTETSIKGVVVCAFKENIILQDTFNSGSEVVGSEYTNRLLTIGYHNNTILRMHYLLRLKNTLKGIPSTIHQIKDRS